MKQINLKYTLTKSSEYKTSTITTIKWIYIITSFVNNALLFSMTFIFTLKLTMSEVVIVVIVVVVSVVLICVGLCIALKKIVDKHIGSHITKNKEEYVGLL